MSEYCIYMKFKMYVSVSFKYEAEFGEKKSGSLNLDSPTRISNLKCKQIFQSQVNILKGK